MKTLLNQRPRWLRQGAVLAIAALLTGCLGGGGESGSTDAGAINAGAVVLSGTAATGKPMAGHVYVTDAAGSEVNEAIDADGSFSVSVEGMTAPFALRAVSTQTTAKEYSVAETSGVTANITPLTTLAIYLASSKSDPASLVSDWSNASQQFDATALQSAKAKINANLAAAFRTEGIDPNTYDFFSASFKADSTGFDAVLDTVTINTTQGTITFKVGGGADQPFDENIDTTPINLGGKLPATLAGKTLATNYQPSTGPTAGTTLPFTAGQQVAFKFQTDGVLLIDGSAVDGAVVLGGDSFNPSYAWTHAANQVTYTVYLSGTTGEVFEIMATDSRDQTLGYFMPQQPQQ